MIDFAEFVSNVSEENSNGIVFPVAYRYTKRAAKTMSWLNEMTETVFMSRLR